LYFSLGKSFKSNGDRYEGEFKDDKHHGKGKNEMIYDLLIKILFNYSSGKWFWNNGDTYEG